MGNRRKGQGALAAPVPGGMGAASNGGAPPDSREAELEAQLRYERGLRSLLQDRVAHLERALASHGVTTVAELAGLSGLSMKDLGVAGDAKGGAGKKRKKDPDRPKRATTAYLVFCVRHRKTVMRKNPELRSKQVTTELARLWQAVENRERSICQEVAQKDAQRHEREMEEYRKRQRKV